MRTRATRRTRPRTACARRSRRSRPRAWGPATSQRGSASAVARADRAGRTPGSRPASPPGRARSPSCTRRSFATDGPSSGRSPPTSRRAGPTASPCWRSGSGRAGGASGSTARSRSRQSACSARTAAGSRWRPPSRGTAAGRRATPSRFASRRSRSQMREAARGARSRRGAGSWTAATGCDGSSVGGRVVRVRAVEPLARPARAYATILTGVPTRTTVRRKTMSWLCRRTQPCETAWPINSGVFVPCTPTTPPPGQSDSLE